MKTKNKFLATILMISAIFLISCESEYHWEKAHFRSVLEARSNSNGYFNGLYDIDIKADVYDVRDRPLGSYVREIEFVDGNILITADERMRELILFVYGGNETVSITLADIRGNNVDNIFDGRAVQDFLYDVSRLVNRYGYVEVEYEGWSVWSGRSYIDIDIYMDVNARVRD